MRNRNDLTTSLAVVFFSLRVAGNCALKAIRKIMLINILNKTETCKLLGLSLRYRCPNMPIFKTNFVRQGNLPTFDETDPVVGRQHCDEFRLTANSITIQLAGLAKPC